MLLSLLTDPGFTDNRLYVVTPTPGNYQLLGPYGEQQTRARWSVLTDGLLPTNQFRTIINNLGYSVRDGRWRIRTDDVSGQIEMDRVERRSIATLTQNTLKTAAYTGEVDLWLMAITHIPGLVSQPGIIDFGEQPTIADMRALWFSWHEALIARESKPRVGPWGDCALMMCSVYAKNVKTGQTLQYEVVTGDNRAFYPYGFWFANLPDGAFMGIADSAEPVYAFPYCQVGEERDVHFDILSRLRGSIENCPNPNVDRELKNWKILMATWGTFTHGAARIVSRWSNMRLECEI